MFSRLIGVIGVLSLVSPSLADIAVIGFKPDRWGFTGASIGVQGLTIESFEDVNLEPGLQIRWTAPAGTFGPTSVLPNTFNPATDDPFGNAFVGGAWDGTNCVVNTRTNRPFPYNESSSWDDVEFQFNPPVRTVAFSVQQMNVNNRIVVNGVDIGSFAALTGLTPDGGRQGYIFFNATGNDTISSIRLDSLGGDGFVVDQLAFTAAPVPRITQSIVPVSQWGTTNGALGFATATIEEFEDAALVPGLQIAWESPLGNTPATSSLPNVFAPETDDPFGNAFDAAVWDGTHVVLNTRDNQSHTYNEVGNWGDIVFHFSPRVTHVGFSMGDTDFTPMLVMDGRLVGPLQNVPFGPRQGFVRVATPRPGFASLRIMNGRQTFNDGIAFDHLAMMNCSVDLNNDTVVNSQDMFDFLTAFFALDPSADYNLDGFINSQDFFDFLSAFFVGC